MGKRERIIALAVRENDLKQQLADVQAELDDLISNRKRPKKKKEKPPTLTDQQREQFAQGPLAIRLMNAFAAHVGQSLSVAQVGEMISAENQNSVRGVLSRLKTDGYVSSAGRGRYSFNAREDSARPRSRRKAVRR